MYPLELAVKNKPVAIESRYLGYEESKWDNKYGADKFICTLTYNGRKESFEFSRGIGYRVVSKTIRYAEPSLAKFAGKELMMHGMAPRQVNILMENSKPTEPDVTSVLCCLLSDADCGEMLFQDFCECNGYSTDSIKALKIYQACQETAIKLRGLFGTDYQYFMDNKEY